MERRDFLRSLAAATTGILVDQIPITAGEAGRDRLRKLLPLRKLGRTGEAVTMLGVGGWHIGRMSETEAQATLETALEGGVRFFDSAEGYQDGGSERRLGKLLTPKHRDLIFLMTKTYARDGKMAKGHLETSLRNLRTDVIDLWQMHTVETPEDVDGRIKEGVLDVMVEAVESGKVRHIGFTGHMRPSAHLRVLERTDVFKTCQLPVNLADPSYESFIRRVVPSLVERKLGIIAMKSLANGGFFGGSQQGEHGDKPKAVPDRVRVADAIHFVLSLPVSVLVTGPDDRHQMAEKIELVRSFQGMNESRRGALINRVSELAKNGLEFYKA